MTANSGEVDLDYKLPESIKGALEGWIGSCQNAAVASVLVASIVAQLMSPVGIIQDPDASKGSINPAALKALTVFSYTALLLSCGATLGALLLIDEFGQLPYRAAQQDNALRGGKIASSLYTFLDGFGLLSLNVGVACLILQVILYVWLTAALAVKIVLLLVTVFSLVPLVLLVLPRPRKST